MPAAPTARRLAVWFWQHAYEGDVRAALDGVLAASFDVVDGSEVWENRGLLMARAYWWLGRNNEARREFEALRTQMERSLLDRPDDPTLHTTLGLCLAGLGRKEDAIREGRHAVELASSRHDHLLTPDTEVLLAEVYAMVGEPDAACSQLAGTLDQPTRVSAALLRIDPRWEPLRNRPCFANLLARRPPRQVS